MNRSAVPVLVLLIFAFASASPMLQSVEADASTAVRQRAQAHVFEWSGNASNVSVHGEWDGWAAGTPLIETAPTSGPWTWPWRLDVLLQVRHRRRLDHGRGQPLHRYCGVTENSVARVANATLPMFSATIEETC